MPKIIALAQDPNISLATAIYTGVSQYIREQGLDWQLILLDHAFESHLINLVESQRLDGAIGSFVSDRWIGRLTKMGLAAVNLFHLSKIQSVPTVGIDDHAIGRQASAHLIEQGAASLTYFGRGNDQQGSARKNGMTESAGPTPIYPSDPFAHPGIRKANYQDMPKPIGFVCSSDRVARDAIREIEEAGLRIGQDALVVGIGDEQAESLFAGVQISSFKIPAQLIGTQAAELLAKQLDPEKKDTEPADLRLITEFIPRASSLPTRQAQLTSRAQQLAKDNISNGDFDINALALMIGASRRTLELAFQKESNESPYQMLSRIRLEEAKQLLESSTLPINEIGQRCGYPEAHHFSAWFKKRTGVSPRNYQKDQRLDTEVVRNREK